MKKFVGLRVKTYSYLKDNIDEGKKQTTEKCDYKKCLKASQIENIIDCLEKTEVNVDSLKEITKYKKEILKK